MKQKLILSIFLGVALVAALAVEIWDTTLTPGATAVVASSTNTTAGTVQELRFAQRPCRIWVTGKGTAATTNGSFIVYFATAADTNTWDTAALSDVKVTLSTIGAATVVKSEWFELAGVKYIRPERIVNTHLGPVSNIAIRIAAPKE